MLFFTLLVYLLMFLPIYRFILPLNQTFRSLPFPVVILSQFIIAFLIGLLIFYLVDVYHPSAKRRIRNLIRWVGIRWVCGLTICFILGCLFVEIFYFHSIPTQFSLGLLIPVFIVSGLNFLGIEIPSKRLEETPEPGKVILPEIPTPLEVKEEIVRVFQWKYEGKDYSFPLVIRQSIYKSFKSRDRVFDISKWAEEYVNGGITGEIREIAYQLYNIGKPYGTYQEVGLVLSFVQQAIQYQSEETEYPKYPVETLVDGEGDCEDFAILGAAILKCMGYEVGLMILPNHAALGVAGTTDIPGVYIEKDSLRYYYCEMTAQGWKIGEMPEEYKQMKVEVYPVPPLPIKVTRVQNDDTI